jgi:hypothetical protein
MHSQGIVNRDIKLESKFEMGVLKREC